MSWGLKSTFASLPFTQRATALVINGDPKGKNMLYCNGKTVYIRDISNPGICDTYTQHSTTVNVAQYAPSGYYIASGDNSGKIRIWDTVNKEHILKYEYQPFAGPVRDLCWSPDSKRLAIGGEGRSTFGACILWDTGSNVGEIGGHTKAINSITYKPTRPFRIATGGEDTVCCFYEGPPFKFKHTMKEHSRFVNSMRFSPNGEFICSGGSDGLAVLYDGKTGDVLSKLGAGGKAHDGGVYGVSWSPDSSHLITASADKSVKLWDVATQANVSQFKIGGTIDDQQLGCLWQDDWIISVSLSGNLNYLNKNDPDKPLRIVPGQNKNLSSIVTTVDSTKLFCGSLDGKVNILKKYIWSIDTGEVSLAGGSGHTNLVCSMAATPEVVYTLGLDKTCRKVSTENNQYLSDVLSVPDLDPTGVVYSHDNLMLIVTLSELILVRDGKKVFTLPVTGEAMCASFHPNKPVVAVGFKKSKVVVYSTEGDKLNEFKEFSINGEVNTLSYDPSGELLAVSGSARPVFIFETTSYTLKKEFMKQNSRVMSLGWSPNGKKIASGGVDSNVCIYELDVLDPLQIKGAHPLEVVTGVSWINDNTIASCGNDSTIRIWEFSA